MKRKIMLTQHFDRLFRYGLNICFQMAILELSIVHSAGSKMSYRSYAVSYAFKRHTYVFHFIWETLYITLCSFNSLDCLARRLGENDFFLFVTQ